MTRLIISWPLGGQDQRAKEMEKKYPVANGLSYNISTPVALDSTSGTAKGTDTQLNSERATMGTMAPTGGSTTSLAPQTEVSTTSPKVTPESPIELATTSKPDPSSMISESITQSTSVSIVVSTSLSTTALTVSSAPSILSTPTEPGISNISTAGLSNQVSRAIQIRIELFWD